MSDVEIRTVEALDDPDCYAGWTVVSFGDDGSVLIQSKTGARERVKVVGTVEMQAEINRLRQRIDSMFPELERIKQHAVQMIHQIRGIRDLNEATLLEVKHE